MNKSCSVELLESALAGELPPEREEVLHHHLDECEACLAALEQMAGGEAGCREAAALLSSDDLDQAAPSREEWSDVDFTVEHLEPSDDPGVLGRLGGYDVLEIIGRGGMGIVLKGFDPELKRCVAIKLLSPHLAQSSLAKKRFAREAQAAAAVVHPNVLAIHQVQPGGRLPFLVMPLVAGESLAQRLVAQGRLEIKEVLRIGMQASAGLAAAHEQGLVHRDVKPANILLEKGVERAVLTDFGLARAADDVTLTRWGIIAGTPQYMSPEQVRGQPLDGRSDLFSLGCVLYEMATGVSPFRTESVIATMRRLVDDKPQAMASLNPELPPWFIVIVDRLLEKDPSRRFGSAKEVSELLEGCLAHVQQPNNVPLPAALPKPALRRAWRSPVIRFKPVLRFKGVLAMIAALGIGLLGMFLLSGPTTEIAGQWSGEEWGQVVLKKTNATEYTGTYSDTDTNHTGEFQLRWSRIERQFTGTWREGDDRFGDISVSPVGNELHVAYGADAKCKDHPGTPHMKGMTWTRATAAVADNQGSNSETAASRNTSAAVEKAVKTISTCAEGDRRAAEAIAALKGLNEAAAVAELAKFLDSKDATIRRAAIFILWQGKFASIEPAAAGLLRLCEHQEDLTRGMAALALGGNRVASGLVVLMKMTSDDRSDYARSRAAIALGYLGSPAATRVLEKALDDPEKLVRANAQAALTMLRGTAADYVPSGMIFSPRIDVVSIHGNKVVIEGRAPAHARISFDAGDRSNGWSCAFPKAAHFTATLEMGPQGLNCRVVPEFGNPLLTIDGAKQIGNVALTEGQFVFHPGPVYLERLGDTSMTIGEWTAKSGAKTPVGVSLSPSAEWGEMGTDGLRIRLLVPSEEGQGPRLTAEDFKAVLEVWNTSNRPVRLAEQYTTGGREMVADDWLIGLGVKVVGEDHVARRFRRVDIGGPGTGVVNFSGLIRTIGGRQKSAFKIQLRRLVDKEGTNLLALRGSYQLVPVLELMPNNTLREDGLWRGQVEGKPVPVQIGPPEGKQAGARQPASDTPNVPKGPLAARMREVLKQPTQLEFVETPLPDVVDYLTDLHHFPFTVSEDVEKMDVTINVKGVALGAALRAIEDKYPALQFVVLDGGIFLMKRETAKRKDFYSAAEFARSGTGSRPRSPIEPNRMVARKIRETLKQPTQLEFVETPAIDVVGYLKDLHHIEFQISEKLESTPLTLNVKKGATGVAALRAIEDKYPSLQFVVRDYGILLTEREVAKRQGYYPAVEFATPVAGPGRAKQPDAGSGPVEKTPAAQVQELSFQKMSSDDYSDRAHACCRNGEYDKAIADYKQALAINPDYAFVYNELAWLYATCPDKKYRDGKKAVDSASKACQLSEATDWPYLDTLATAYADWPFLDTLAAAYAESGDFEKAKQWEAKAIEMAPEDKEVRSRMELYKQGKPYREESK